jgi:hypothetical protein
VFSLSSPQKLHMRLDPWRGKYLTSGGDKFSPIRALVASLYIAWVSTGFRMGCTNKWIVLGLIFCGKASKISLGTIWQNGKWYLGPKIRMVVNVLPPIVYHGGTQDSCSGFGVCLTRRLTQVTFNLYWFKPS